MKRESHVCFTYPDGRYVVATTTDPALAIAMTKAVLDLRCSR